MLDLFTFSGSKAGEDSKPEDAASNYEVDALLACDAESINTGAPSPVKPGNCENSERAVGGPPLP